MSNGYLRPPYGDDDRLVVAQHGPSAASEFDPTRIEYRKIGVSDWASIPAAESVYSHYWSNPSEFEPEHFADNISAKPRYFDLGFAIAFLVNLVISIGLAAYLIATKSPTVPHPDSRASFSQVDLAVLGRAIVVGSVIGILVNSLHFIYAASRPRSYIESGLFFTLIFAGASVILPLFAGSFGSLFFPAIMLAVTCLWYALVKHRIPFSAAIFERAMAIARAYPSIIGLAVGQLVFQVVLACGFGLTALSMQTSEIAGPLYFYLLFSYFWTLFTFSYVVYMTGAGLAARHYFLRGTEYMPRSPVWDSFKLAATTSFGSAAAAGLLLAVIRTLRAILESTRGKEDDERNRGLALLKCVAICLLALLEGIARFISRYALIYCSVWGVPYSEGCRRWCELECTKFIRVIIDGDIIGTSMAMNALAFIISTGLVAWAAGKVAASGAVTAVVAAAVIVGALLSAIVRQPVQVMVDTLFLCFAEDPERLRVADPDLFERLEGQYRTGLNGKVSREA